REAMASMLNDACAVADVLLLCGDLTDRGDPAQAEKLIRDIDADLHDRTLCVLGNHDHATDRQQALVETLKDAGLHVLDGDYTAIDGVGFVGVSGFCGGFGKLAVQPFGERALREFVDVTVEEALKLETALSQSNIDRQIALLHYAPIRDTVEGEPDEIYPFLGASRLADPLNQYEVDAIFHGHAHGGAPRGETSAGIPVYNVSVPVLKRHYPEAPPFRTYEIELD
ncbi:MAG: metallophosphoesterase, partial [Bradymonadaceae bacterium]